LGKNEFFNNFYLRRFLFGSDCFDVLGRPTLGLSGSQFMKKSKFGTK
jgi:hypothetical protein